ncbi:MAG: glutamate--tRNA ligase family protein [Bacteroidia bacterium]
MFKSRIAPTPSGYLHIGNACNFLLTWLWTRAENGQLLLRIDDLDRSRKRPEYVEDVFETLEWLGIDYDEGPTGPSDFENNWSQHLRLEAYAEALDVLKEQRLLFACDCTRSQILTHAENGQYAGRCRKRELAFEEGIVAWRIKTGLESEAHWQDVWLGKQSLNVSQKMCDFVIRRKDQLPAYQLASVVDDTIFGVNAVVRGDDLLHSTAAQIWLSQYLPNADLTAIRWVHHPLLQDTKGLKLSKSKGSLSIQSMRGQGASPATVYQACADLMGWSGSFFSLQGLLDAYIQRPKFTY